MELTFEVRRKKDVLARKAVEVEGLDAAPRPGRPVYIDLHLRLLNTGQQAPSEEDQSHEPDVPAPETVPPQTGSDAAKVATPKPPPPPPEPLAGERAPQPEPVASAQATQDQTQTVESPQIPHFDPPIEMPGVSEPKSLPPAQTLDDFRAQVESATAALPFLPITPERKLGGAGGKPPKPSKATYVEKPPARAPRPSPENPVPEPIWELDKAAYAQLPSRVPPQLKARPASDPAKFGGLKLPEPTAPHFLDAGKAVVDPVKMSVLRKMAAEGAGALKQFQAVDPQSEQAGFNAKTEKEITDLYQKILAGDTEEEKKQKKDMPLPRKLAHVEEIDPTEYLKGDKDEKGKETRADVDPAEAARVWARLLAKPKDVAAETMVNIRESMYPGMVVQQVFPAAGAGLEEGLAAELTKEYRAIAEAALGGKELLDAAIAERQKELAQQIKTAAFGESKSIVEAAKATADEHAEAEAKQKGQLDAVQKQAGKAKAAIATKTHPETEKETQDRLLAQVQQKVGVATTRFLAMEARRKSDTDASEGTQIRAYEYAAQRDELQTLSLNADKPGEARDSAVKEITDWLETKRTETKAAYGGFRELDANALTIFRADLVARSTAACRAIRVWADTKRGFHIDEEQRAEEARQDKIAQDVAIEAAKRQLDLEKIAKSANARLSILGDLHTAIALDAKQGKEKDSRKKEALLAGKELNNEQRQVVAAVLGGSGQDPYQLIANGIRSDTAAQKLPVYFPEIKKDILNRGTWQQLEKIGNALGGEPFKVSAKANDIRNAAKGYTSDDDAEKMLASLVGMNEFTVIALRRYYLEEFHMSLYEDLEDDLDDDVIAKEEGQKDRAYALINQAGSSVWKGEPQFANLPKEQLDASSPYVQSPEFLEAQSEALAAEIFRHGKGQWGTKEAETLAALRSCKSKAECDRLIETYRRMGYGDLREDLKAELNDWSTRKGHNAKDQADPISHDAARAEALLNFDKEKADAIAIDQEMFYDQWGRGDRDDVEAIYNNVEEEVRKEAGKSNPPRNSAWVAQETKARLARITKTYDEMYVGTTTSRLVKKDPSDPSSPMVQATRGSLQENFIRFMGQNDGSVLVKESEYDKEGAEAARLLAEKNSAYVGDEASNKIFLARQERARKDAALDSEPYVRFFAEDAMRLKEDSHFRKTGRFWSMTERYKEKQLMEVAIDRGVDAIANKNALASMQKLDREYQKISGGQTLAEYVLAGMSGPDQDYALVMVTQGYLTPKQKLELATRGWGTNEDLVKSALKGLTKDEIDAISAAWEDEHGETLFETLDEELSGDDWIEAQVAMRGRPLSLEDAIATAKLREQLSRPGAAGSAAVLAFGGADVNKSAADALADLETLAKQMDDPRYANLTPEQQEGWLKRFDTEREMVEQSIESRNAIVSDVTDSVVNAVSMVVAIAVGAILSPFTAGLSAAVAAAVIASLAATVTSVALRRLMMGARYGSGQIAMDLAIGAIDAVVAGLTAGMGNRLLGIRQMTNAAALKGVQEAAKKGSKMAVIQLFLHRFGTTGALVRNVRAVPFLEKMAAKEASLLSRAVANGIAITAENVVQSVPSAIVANVANEDNWKQGDPFTNIVAGVGQQVGMGAAQGLAFAAGHAVVGPAITKVVDYAKGPKLGKETYKQFSTKMSAEDRLLAIKENASLHPGEGPAEFDARVARENESVDREARTQQRDREAVVRELKQAHPEGSFDGVPVTVLSRAEYLRVAGIGKPDVVFIMRDGQMHLVMREGGNPQHAAQHAGKIAERIEKGSGGRLSEKGLRESLPRALQGKVSVTVNPSLEPHEIHVHRGPIVEVVVGPGVSAESYANHLRVAKGVLAIQGAHGKAAKLLQMARLWSFEHGFPPSDSVAFLAHHEVRKLPREIAIIEKQLMDPDLSHQRHLELLDQLDNLDAQLEYHRGELDNFEKAPADAFIAANKPLSKALDDRVVDRTGIPHPDDPAQRLHPVALGTLIEQGFKLADDSPLHDAYPGRVFELGLRYGKGRTLRTLVAFDAHGKIKEIIQERWVTRKKPNGGYTQYWAQRGSETNYRGTLTENASLKWDLEQLKSRQKTSPADFILDVQNKSGHGFDRVLVKYRPEDYVNIATGELKPGATPKLVLVEDKSSAIVSAGEISAIGPRLKKNIDALAKGNVPKKDPTSTAPDIPAKVINANGTATSITDGHIKAVKQALAAGDIEVELRVVHGEALKGGTEPNAFRDAKLVKDVLDDIKGQGVFPGIRKVDVVGIELSTKAKAEYALAFKDYDLVRLRGKDFPLNDRLKVISGSNTPHLSIEAYHAVFFIDKIANPPGNLQASFLTPPNPPPLGMRLIADGGSNSYLHISTRPPDLAAGKYSQDMGDFAAGLINGIDKSNTGNATKPKAVLHQDGWLDSAPLMTHATPPAAKPAKGTHLDNLKAALAENAVKGNKLDTLKEIFVYGDGTNPARRLFDDQEIKAMQTKATPTGAKKKK